MTMQLIVLYILWRFTKAILVGWSKDRANVKFEKVFCKILNESFFSCSFAPFISGFHLKF